MAEICNASDVSLQILMIVRKTGRSTFEWHKVHSWPTLLIHGDKKPGSNQAPSHKGRIKNRLTTMMMTMITNRSRKMDIKSIIILTNSVDAICKWTKSWNTVFRFLFMLMTLILHWKIHIIQKVCTWLDTIVKC